MRSLISRGVDFKFVSHLAGSAHLSCGSESRANIMDHKCLTLCCDFFSKTVMFFGDNIQGMFYFGDNLDDRSNLD